MSRRYILSDTHYIFYLAHVIEFGRLDGKQKAELARRVRNPLLTYYRFSGTEHAFVGSAALGRHSGGKGARHVREGELLLLHSEKLGVGLIDLPVRVIPVRYQICVGM